MTHDHDEYDVGLVLEMGVNMWGEEVIPSGVRILWRSGDIEVTPEDELMLIEEIKKRAVHLRE
jgi:hypothetical protein